MTNADNPRCVFCRRLGLRCCTVHEVIVCQRCYDLVTEKFLIPTLGKTAEHFHSRQVNTLV